MNKPMMRFSGFDDEWGQEKLEDIFVDGYSGGTPKVGTKSYYDGDIPFLAISDINGRYLGNIEKSITNEGLDNSSARMVPTGSISLAMYASVGKVAISSQPMATSQAFYNMVFDEPKYRDFVYTVFDRMDRFDGWRALISEGTQKNLNAGKVKSFNITIPSLDEAGLIGNFFKTIDDLISAQEETVEAYEQYKEAMLQKMFPKKGKNLPEVRFDGFDDEWEEKKLGDVVDVNKGQQVNKSKLLDEPTGEYIYPVYNGGIDISGYYNKPNRISKVAISEGGASAGHVNYVDGEFWSGGHNYTLDSDQDNGLFLYAYMVSNQLRLYDLKMGSGLPNIRKSDLELFNVCLPSLPEQQAIGQFFKTFDELIAKQEEKVENGKLLKKALLQKMFV